MVWWGLRALKTPEERPRCRRSQRRPSHRRRVTVHWTNTGQRLDVYWTTRRHFDCFSGCGNESLSRIASNRLRSIASAAKNAPLGKNTNDRETAFSLAAQPLIASRKNACGYDELASGVYQDKETGLLYSYFRDCYDSGTGRFCQPDPAGTVFFGDMGFRSLGVLGLMQPRLADVLYSETPRYNHPYLYAKANPLRFTDPDGLVAMPAGSASIISEAPGAGSAGGQSPSSGAMMMCAAGDRSACYEMCNVIRDAKVFACAGDPACISAANRWWTMCRARCAATY
jgi:hypothetical protein